MTKTNEETSQGETPAIERGAIDAGKTGEKVAGFDPATAPMETDAEAGGAATPQVATAPRSPPKNLNAASSGSAMRSVDKSAGVRQFRGWAIGISIVLLVLIAAVFLGGDWLMR